MEEKKKKGNVPICGCPTILCNAFLKLHNHHSDNSHCYVFVMNMIIIAGPIIPSPKQQWLTQEGIQQQDWAVVTVANWVLS